MRTGGEHGGGVSEPLSGSEGPLLRMAARLTERLQSYTVLLYYGIRKTVFPFSESERC